MRLMMNENAQKLSSETPFESFRISERWEVVAEAGYQALPDVLLFAQSELRLTSEELNVLLNLTAHWWRPKDVVFPRADTIAARMGVSARTVQRILKSLQAKGFIVKSRAADGRPVFDVTPTKALLVPFAMRRVEEKRQAAKLRELERTRSLLGDSVSPIETAGGEHGIAPPAYSGFMKGGST